MVKTKRKESPFQAIVERQLAHLRNEGTPDAERIILQSRAFIDPEKRARFIRKMTALSVERTHENNKYKDGIPPVGVREFIESPKFMNKKGKLWPRLIDQIEEACSGKYVEGVFTGGIGCGKTTAALYIQAYLLYMLSRMVNPHEEFGLDEASEIMIIFQSLSSGVAKVVEYDRFREMIETAPYFKQNFRHDFELKLMMVFPNRIIVRPVSGSDTAAIGQNVISAIIDEVNFMAVVQKSKQSRDGGEYNQAIELYNSIVRRRESRFMRKGKVWGLLCLVSSARYPGQFTDRRRDAAERQKKSHGSTNIFIYDKRAWEVMDENAKDYSYTGVRFNLFLGDEARKPRILKDGETVALADRKLIMDVPVEHLHAFEDDIYDAIRDIGGLPTLAAHPFIPSPEKIADMFGKVKSIFSRDEIDFVETKLMIYPKRFVNPHLPRYVHCDLALTGDSCGMAIGHVKGFRSVERSPGQVEMLPEIVIDGLLEIKPPKNGEIDLARVRGVIYKLREMGLNVKWVSYDSFASADSIQIMRQQGYAAGEVSVDTTPVPYEITKQAILDGRIEAPEHQKCQMEFVTLERDPATGKIDHPEISSKDVADAFGATVYGLTMRREIWAMNGINPQRIPQSVKGASQNYKRSVEGGIS